MKNTAEMNIDFDKAGGLVPVVIQDHTSGKVLMLGYMNAEAVAKTQETGLVTFYSRSKKRLWTKGETSGNTLELRSMHVDCDNDALLIQAKPNGPTCHTGEESCFFTPERASTDLGFLAELEDLLVNRKKELPEGSYTSTMFKKGTDKLAQKVGEEAVETVIAAKNNNEELRYEASDLLFHLMMLLVDREMPLADLVAELRKRHKK